MLSFIFLLLKCMNYLFIKKENHYFFEPLRNCLKDNYDIINFTGNTILSYLNYFLEHDNSKKVIYLVIYHPERIVQYKSYIKKFNNVKFVFLLSEYLKFNYTLKNRFKKTIALFKSKYIFYEPIFAGKFYFTKKQQIISLGYFSSFKSDFNLVPYNSVYKKWSLISSTSKLDSILKSSAFGVPFNLFKPFGLARNDYLFIENDAKKKIKIYEWLKKHSTLNNPKIILYAPTYRDYESREDILKRSIWGFDIDRDMDKYLEKNNLIVIAKLHSWQTESIINNTSGHVVYYKDTFDFSFYDLMKESILLISDYSSVVLDYLLLDKPIIFNLYDLEKYLNVRGFAYEPYEDYCPGVIVKNRDELIDAIDKAIKNDEYRIKREYVKKMAYLYPDNKSCERIYNFLSKSNKNER